MESDCCGLYLSHPIQRYTWHSTWLNHPWDELKARQHNTTEWQSNTTQLAQQGRYFQRKKLDSNPWPFRLLGVALTNWATEAHSRNIYVNTCTCVYNHVTCTLIYTYVGAGMCSLGYMSMHWECQGCWRTGAFICWWSGADCGSPQVNWEGLTG